MRFFVCPSFDRRYPTYHVHISFTTNKFTRPCLLHLPWPSHLLASYWAISPSGPRVPVHHLDWQIPLWSINILINHIFRNTQSAPLYPAYFCQAVGYKSKSPHRWQLRMIITVKGSSHYVIVIAMSNYVTWSHRNTSGGCMSIISLSNDTTPLSTDAIVSWSGNLDHQSPNGLVY